MNLHDMMDEDASSILTADELGYAAVYTRKEEDSEIEIVVITEPMFMASQIKGYSIQVTSDILITKLEFSPEVYDTIRFNQETWNVGEHEIHGPWTVINVYRDKVPTTAKTGFR